MTMVKELIDMHIINDTLQITNAIPFTIALFLETVTIILLTIK